VLTDEAVAWCDARIAAYRQARAERVPAPLAGLDISRGLRSGDHGDERCRVVVTSWHWPFLRREMTVGVVDPHAGDPGPLGIGERPQKRLGNGQRIYKGLKVELTAKLGDVDGCEHRRVGDRIAMNMDFDYGTEGQCGAMFDDARHAENPRSSNQPNRTG